MQVIEERQEEAEEKFFSLCKIILHTNYPV